MSLSRASPLFIGSAPICMLTEQRYVIPSRLKCTDAVLSRPKYLLATRRMLSRACSGRLLPKSTFELCTVMSLSTVCNFMLSLPVSERDRLTG